MKSFLNKTKNTDEMIILIISLTTLQVKNSCLTFLEPATMNLNKMLCFNRQKECQILFDLKTSSLYNSIHAL